MFHQIVDRCNVSDSHLFVLRYVISRLKGKKKNYNALSREQRRFFIKSVFDAHNENIALYREVMS